jgi:hypothetical protein
MLYLGEINQPIEGYLMLGQVKIYGKSGELKQIIPAKKVSKDFWDKISKDPGGLRPSVKELGKAKCGYCKEWFKQKSYRDKYCKKPGLPDKEQCQRLSYAEKNKKPVSEGICDICKKPFTRRGNRTKYCGNPCEYKLQRKL